MRVHYAVVRPVVDELLRRNWQVRILHIERMWEKVERFLALRKKRSLASYYVKPSGKPQGRIKVYAYNAISKGIFYTVSSLGIDKPNVMILMSESTPPTKIACKTGKLLGVPILDLLQLGMLGHHYECPEFLADKISVPGEFIKDLLINCGIDESRVVVTGRPTYDALIRVEESFKKEQICKKLGLDPARKILVYATENLPPWEIQPLVYALCRIMKKLSDVQFVIKVHPSEPSLSLYERVSKNVGVQCLITREANIYEILFVCDLMITMFSTTALDAMILDKPVVTINLTGLGDPIPFAESGAAIGVYRKGDIEQAIRDGLYDEAVRERLTKDREKFVFEQAYKKDGKATDRIVDLIEHMVTEKRKYG
jgi:hypothetical protein